MKTSEKIFSLITIVISASSFCMNPYNQDHIAERKYIFIDRSEIDSNKDNEKKSDCTLCRERYSGLKIPATHIKTHQKQFNCIICDYELSSPENLELHMIDYHDILNPVQGKTTEVQVLLGLLAIEKAIRENHNIVTNVSTS